MRFLYKGWFDFTQALRLMVAVSGLVHVAAAIETAPVGRLSGWELIR